jgi:type III secretion system YopN/LcrE/InvE/MxiC family regulator
VDISSRLPANIGLRSPKHQAKLDERQKNDAMQAENQLADEGGPVADIESVVQSVDEMSAALTQFRNRRDYDKKLGAMFDNFERVLDEDEAQPKAQHIIQVAKKQGLSAVELLRQARSLFPDDSDLVLVLRELLRRRQLDEITHKRLQNLLKQVEQTAPQRSLKAGINCALKARLFGKKLSLSPGLLRASYRRFLESDETEAALYEEWIVSYGWQYREVVVDFIENALLADIDSLDPSCTRLEFGRFLARLSQLKLLRSIEALFIDNMLRVPCISTFKDNEEEWLIFLLTLLQQPQSLDELLLGTIGEKVLSVNVQAHSLLLQTLYRSVKSLPPRLFVDERWHQWILDELLQMSTLFHQRELRQRRFEHPPE